MLVNIDVVTPNLWPSITTGNISIIKSLSVYCKKENRYRRNKNKYGLMKYVDKESKLEPMLPYSVNMEIEFTFYNEQEQR